MASPYAFRLALQSLRKDMWINLLSMLTIFAGLFIISLSFFIFYNIDAATRNLPEKFSLVIYLDDNLSRDKVDDVIAAVRSRREVASVKYISKEDAFRELKATLKNSQYVLEGINDNPLPDSLEVKLRRDAMGSGPVRQFAESARKIPGVNDVDYGEKFLSTLHDIRNGIRTVGILLAAILSTGIVFVCYSTVKILFYRRNDEIETFKLLGATKGFIRAPFLIEGAAIGTAGGLTSLIALYLLHHAVILRMGASVPFFTSLLYPARIFLSLPLVGMFLGLSGAAIALGRLKY
ncbi:MAG TPA: permease-like cell division protein FtsX [Thermodesulfovibrionales bacterium]|nr:permease-like cell division protein FtsX [Thermodesulfovibrionales bacterium]